MNAPAAAVSLRFRAARLGALVKREVRDQLRDWRVVIPMAILTLFFPVLMNFAARAVINYVNQYGGQVVAEAVFPFLLMIVGFFPTSVGLVIALESFVGEKERFSLEPLLATPLTDLELFLGKVSASVLTPLAAAGLGITAYLAGMYFLAGWFPPLELLFQIVILTAAHAVCMVSAAVVISAQTNSVRAANLLASFVIVPFALLMQGESMVMFYRMYGALWWVIAGVVLLAVIFIRIGLRQFRREELLSREVEELRFDRMGAYFWRAFSGGARHPLAWHRLAVLPALRRTLPAFPWTAAALALGAVLGIVLSERFPIPAEAVNLQARRGEFLEALESIGFFTAGGTWMIFTHNLQAIFLASMLGMISLGIMGLVVLMLPIGIIAYATAAMAGAGASPWMFFLGFVLPHGIVEIPAMWIAGAAILRLGNCLLAKPEGRSLGQIWLQALADWLCVLLGAVLPLQLLAAVLETWVTPLAAAGVMGW
ncbi:MAG: stage II sporulation protein M [Anaerolineales bacterium]|nr:stage II sporulation protein M [Anaerolineales bacterium]